MAADDFDEEVRAGFADPRGLRSRIDLYARFQVGAIPWHDWLFERVECRAGQEVLDLGCGTGDLWMRAGVPRAGLPRLTLVDRSAGMLEACGRRFGGLADLVEADLHAWGPAPRAFDRVVAAHVLFLLRDPARLCLDVATTLRPDGFALFTAPALDHLGELSGFLDQVLGESPGAADLAARRAPERIEAAVRAGFSDVRRIDYRADLRVTTAGPLVDCVRGSFGLHAGRLAAPGADDLCEASLRERVAREVATRGAWRLTVHNVCLRASRPREGVRDLATEIVRPPLG